MSLASIYSARGKHELAEPLLQQVLEWRESWVKFSMGFPFHIGCERDGKSMKGKCGSAWGKSPKGSKRCF